MGIIVLAGCMLILIILCFAGHFRLKSPVLRMLLGLIGGLLAAVLCICLVFAYALLWQVSTIDAATSPDGNYRVVFQEIGEPLFFGASDCRLKLKQGMRTIAQCSFPLANDGKRIDPDNWVVTWEDDHVQVVVSGEEQGDRRYDMYFDGRTEGSGQIGVEDMPRFRCGAGLKKREGNQDDELIDRYPVCGNSV
jgi:hypothetical protein